MSDAKLSELWDVYDGVSANAVIARRDDGMFWFMVCKSVKVGGEDDYVEPAQICIKLLITEDDSKKLLNGVKEVVAGGD